MSISVHRLLPDRKVNKAAFVSGRAKFDLIPNGRWSPESTSHPVFGLIAMEDGKTVGRLLGESHPRVYRILGIDGEGPGLEALLDRAIAEAGERRIGGYTPVNPEVRDTLRRKGFRVWVDSDGSFYRFKWGGAVDEDGCD
jgi:hypothetical protein